MRHYSTLAWPQNAGNPVFKDLSFGNFSWEDAPGTSYRCPSPPYCIRLGIEANVNNDVSNDLPYFSLLPFSLLSQPAERLRQSFLLCKLRIDFIFFRQMQREYYSRQLLRVPIQVWWSNLQGLHKTWKPIKKSLVRNSPRLPQRTPLGVLQRKKM